MADPVVKSIEVPIGPEAAFRLFTESVSLWWPLGTHSVFGPDSVSVRFEPRVGGQVTETSSSGQHAVWGTVTTWRPPEALAFSWHVGRDPEVAQEVTVTFAAGGPGTVVRLEHAHWDALGEGAAEERESYDDGWDHVFCEAYGNAARAHHDT